MGKRFFIILGGSGKLGRELYKYISDYYIGCRCILTFSNHNLKQDVESYHVNFLCKDSVDEFLRVLSDIFVDDQKVDVCVINAMGKYYKEDFAEFSADMFEQTMAVHCTNFCYFLSKIINDKSIVRFNCIYISSNLTLRCNKGTYSYIASKQAGESIMKQLAAEHKYETNYRFNIIAPGYFGDMLGNDSLVKNYNVTNDICRAIVFFDNCNITSGSKIVIDGGETIGY